MTDNETAGVLYAVVCGAGPASRIGTFVTLAQAEGWEVCCIATPAAVEHFLDVPALQELSGHHVRSNYRASDDEPFPRADAIAVAPATYNTINKWAAGISDTYALNLLAELTGLSVPTAVLPCCPSSTPHSPPIACSPEASTSFALPASTSSSDPTASDPIRHAWDRVCSTITRGISHWTHYESTTKLVPRSRGYEL